MKKLLALLVALPLATTMMVTACAKKEEPAKPAEPAKVAEPAKAPEPAKEPEKK